MNHQRVLCCKFTKDIKLNNKSLAKFVLYFQKYFFVPFVLSQPFKDRRPFTLQEILPYSSTELHPNQIFKFSFTAVANEYPQNVEI
jgi:hypothetical protein